MLRKRDLPQDDAAALPDQQKVLLRHKDADVKKSGYAQCVVCLCMVCLVEGVDSVLLPTALFALQRDLGLSLQDVATMSVCQSVAAAACGPMWGIMADRGLVSRKVLLVNGCMAVGLLTMCLSRVDRLGPMLFLRTANGAVLSCLGPIARGIIADIVPKERRGQVFGYLAFTNCFGGMFGSIVGTQLSSSWVYGMQGWRLSFLMSGSIGVIVGTCMFLFMAEPAKQRSAHEMTLLVREPRSVREELKRLGRYFQIMTFNIIVIQGCFGLIPWNALSYSSLFYRLSGLIEHEISILLFVGQVSNALGNLLGGIVGDTLSRKSPNHGRPLTAQISVICGIVPVMLLFVGSPPVGVPTFNYYLALLVVMGLTATWNATGVNAPILCDIVNVDESATVMAWESALECSFASLFGNLLVGFLGQTVFGYDFRNPEGNKEALGKALGLTATIPWLLCFCAFSYLHQTYPADRDRAHQRQHSDQAAKEPSTEPAPLLPAQLLAK